MHVSHITISNVLGIEHLDLEAGQFNLISGDNGTGKTSILEAIKAVVEGGQDATLIRKGQKTGEIVLLLDDGTEIKHRITEKTQTTTVEKDGVRQSNPRSYIKGIADLLSTNPIDFLRAPKKDRLRVLLESLPTQADADRIRKIVGQDSFVVSGANALEQIDAAHTTVFNERTGTNRAIREKNASINQLSITLPAAGEGTTSDDPAEIEAQLARMDEERDTALAAVEGKLAEYRTAHAGRLVTLDAAVEEARAALEVARAAVQTEKDWMASTAGKAEAKRSALRLEASEKRAPVAAELQVIRNNLGAASRSQQTRATIKTFEGELETLQADEARQTASLAALDAYKLELLAALPVDGLEVKDGEIWRGGVVFDRLNTAQQVDIAVDIAKLRAGELGVICVDGMEALSAPAFEAFRDRIKETDLQLFVTRVTAAPLKIETQ